MCIYIYIYGAALPTLMSRRPALISIIIKLIINISVAIVIAILLCNNSIIIVLLWILLFIDVRLSYYSLAATWRLRTPRDSSTPAAERPCRESPLRIHIGAHVCVCIYIYIYIHVCIYIYIYTHIHMCIHIYIYIYVYRWRQNLWGGAPLHTYLWILTLVYKDLASSRSPRILDLGAENGRN